MKKEKIKSIFNEKIEDHLYKYYWEELGLKDWKRRIKDRVNEVPRNETILKTIEYFIGSFQGKKILIVGSGWGGACVAAKNLGVEKAIGIDIDNKVNEVANMRMCLEGYADCCFTGAAEYLPFKNNQFDYIHCFTVLEHVENVQTSLSEMIRVIKRGGYVFIQAPSYLRPTERHYKIPYIPLMPKKLARIYLRLWRRPTEFIDSINYIWPSKIKNILSNVKDIEIKQIANEYECIFKSFIIHGGNNNLSLKSRLLIIFYKTWDSIFRTKEIYFLIRKY